MGKRLLYKKSINHRHGEFREGEDRMGESLADGIQRELKRNRESLIAYEKLPDGAGVFGAALIKGLIERTEKAILDGDLVEMIGCYVDLKNTQ